MAEHKIPRQTQQGTTAIVLYGVVPADVEVTPDAEGIGDPPAKVALVAHGEVAALVSEVDPGRPLGRPEDLRAYKRLLDGTAAVAPVLPVRFGAVLTDGDAVADLLAANHDDFRSALDELEGRVEYAVRGRYVQRVVLSEVLDENAEAAQLRERIRDQPEEATVNLRIRLGEIVHQVLEAKRDADTRRVVDTLGPFSERVVVRPATHEEDAANVALLVETAQREEFEQAVRELAGEWSDRVTLRLLGPLAPYDFVAQLEREG